MSDLSKHSTKNDLVLGVAIMAFAGLIGFVWIPLDIETGIFEKVRRRTEIGDAFAPALAAGLLALGGLLLLVESLRTRSLVRLSLNSLTYTAGLLGLFVIFTLLLTWIGPIAVVLFAEQAAEYRLLRNTAPWKYLGFVVGGTFLVAALISFMEHRLRWQSVLLGVLATIALILVYDLPFDNLLLPPNGDF